MRTYIPELIVPVEGLGPATDAAGRTSVYISLKTAVRVWVVVHVTQANAATVLLTPLQALTVAGGSSKVLANVVPIWANLDCAASDTLVRATDAVSYTTDAGTKHKIVVFAVDGIGLDVDGGFCCVGISTGASDVANLTSAVFYVETAYPSATPPSVVID